jgi:CheY-like chemotaxis protein
VADALRALVVDDDEACIEHVMGVLHKFGWAADASHDGLDALRRCQMTRYDLVICDIRMPRLSGLSFLSNLSQTQNAMTRVVIVSALDDRAIRRQALASGASAYLVKPLDTQELIEALALPSIRPVDEGP